MPNNPVATSAARQAADKYNASVRSLLSLLSQVRLFIRKPLDSTSPLRTSLHQLSANVTPTVLASAATYPTVTGLLTRLHDEHERICAALDHKSKVCHRLLESLHCVIVCV